MKKLYFFFITLFFSFTLFAQNVPPKRQFRAVWVASVSNIDWPTSKYLSPASQRSQYISLIDQQKKNGMNAVIVQVRPSCDAFYPSDIEPWSEWLTGSQGRAPNPYYDPLKFMIDETHKRGIEFHAWFNPYRAVVSTSSSSVSATHVSKTHPDWIITYGTLKVLNPGLPEVREYVVKVIMDVVRRYDIDGVHFDDYFYPYPKSGVTFDDDATFSAYPRGFTNKADWRRDNVNLLIKMVHDSLNAVKPWIKFGISPFGIWKNKSSDSNGSATYGLESYSAIYADSREWLKQGWLDYINPQIYWNIGYNAARYEVLVPWWVSNSFNRHVYVGEAAYRIPDWSSLSEMPNHLRLDENYTAVKGNVFFSSKSITNNFGGFQDSLQNNFYKYPALPPVMYWKDHTPPNSPVNLSYKNENNHVTLNWEAPSAASDGDSAKYFVVYRFNSGDNMDLEDPRFIKLVSADAITTYTDPVSIDEGGNSVTYAVTAVDDGDVESEQSIVVLGNLPVELTTFSASQFDGNVTLAWETATELNNSGFRVERKSNGYWRMVGFVKGHGTTTEKSSYTFIDNPSDVQDESTISYRLKQVDLDGTYSYSKTINIDFIPKPNEYALLDNYPNPFNPNTVIGYRLADKSLVTIKVYDLIGREVATLVKQEQPAGAYKVKFNAVNLPSGIYIYQLQANNYVATKKMTLLK